MGAQPRLSIQGATDEILRRGQAGPTGATYGQRHAPPPTDLDELRRQQHAFKQAREELEGRNWWMAVPALAPAAAVLGLEGAAAIAARFAAAGAAGSQGPLVLLEREPWFRNLRPPAEPPKGPPKGAIREKARRVFARANDVGASELNAHVHHSDPLEWAHIKPGADPNRLANLWALSPEEHAIATREWASRELSRAVLLLRPN